MGLKYWKQGPYKVRQLVSKSTYVIKNGNKQGLSQLSTDTAIRFAPFRRTHPPPTVPTFLIMQNLFPKDISRSEVMKLKVS